jgi:PAS domain S-box-containing protein
MNGKKNLPENENLKPDESRLQEIIENMPFPVAILTKNGTTEYINSDFEKLTSFKLSDINTIQKWFNNFFPGLDIQNKIKKDWIETLELIPKADRIEKEFKIITGEKEEKFVQFRISYVQDKIMLAINDLTHRKKILSLIRESEKRQSILLQNLQGMVFQSKFERNIRMNFVSEGAFKLTGYFASEFTDGKTISFNKLIVEKYRDYVWETIQAAVKNEEPYELQYQIITRSGEKKWINEKGTGLFDESGICYGIEGFLTDITDRVKMLDNLILNEQKYRSLFENMPLALWEDDYSEIILYLKKLEESGISKLEKYFSDNPQNVLEIVNKVKIIDLNKESVRLYETKNKEELLKSMDKVFMKEDYPAFARTILSLYKGKTNIENYVSKFKINNTQKTLSISWFVMPGHEKDLSRVLVSINDITVLTEAEKEIHKLNRELEEKVVKRTRELDETNKELEAFSYSVSHDLKAPLRAIKGFSELLLTELKENTDNKVTRDLNNILENTDKMSGLINDLLQFSRLGKNSLNISSIDTTSLVNSIWAELVSYHPDKKAQLNLNNLHPIRGDQSLIRLVFINLLSNSLKFTDIDRIPIINIKSEKKKGFIEFSLSDNGIGFNQKFEEKIFMVFQRLHTVDEYEGNGIGLALVKRIILMHGGQISVRSQEKQGTEFIFSISVEIDSEL